MDLWSGPRGRRLCLEVARLWAYAGADEEHGPEFVQALFFAGHDLDFRAETPGLMSIALEGPPGAALPTYSSADVARLWAEVPQLTLDDDLVRAALVAAVDAAAYWQPPDGEDVLAAREEMRESLAAVAEAIDACDAVAWWRSPADLSNQWTVVFDYQEGLPHAAAREPAAVLAEWRAAVEAEEARARRELSADPTESVSGPWWSKPPHGLTRTTRAFGARGPVGLSLVEDGHGPERATVRRASVPTAARVYEIDGAKAWAELCRRFPIEVTASRRHDWFSVTGEAGRWVIPDWSQMAGEYDGVHLTVAGYLETAGRAVPVGDGASTVLAGWDPDATFWFAAVRAYEDSQQAWVSDDEVWSLASAPGA